MDEHRRTILLGMPSTHNIFKLFVKNLEFYGFNVLYLQDIIEGGNKVKASILDLIKVKIRKKLFKDKQAKIRLQSELIKRFLIEKNSKFDYSLFILGNHYSKELIQYIKLEVAKNKVVNYQWDGIERYPDILDRIPYFDQTYVFDSEDIAKYPEYSFLPITNFYFDYDLKPLENIYDFYFLGGHIEDRADIITAFLKYAEENSLSTHIEIVCRKKDFNHCRLMYPRNVKLKSESHKVDYLDNLTKARQSKVLLDFVISSHSGLSLRVFEALAHDKKLITTNKEIRHYDFYHPNNIFILDDNFSEIPAFLSKPYFYIEDIIKQKYSFGNWINYILDIKPNQPILLPAKRKE